VRSLHDLHVWSLTTGKASLTAHVVYDRSYDAETQILPVLKEILAERFGVYHTTVQFETVPCAHKADGCNYVGTVHEHGHQRGASETRVSSKSFK
jgi:cobalt-zinc-cadmium efflux system protein